MSEATAEFPNIIGHLPPYYGKTKEGERVLGSDTDYLAHSVITHILRPRARKPVLENLDALTPETSEALENFSRLTRAIAPLLDAPLMDEFGPVRPMTESVQLATSTLFPLVQHGFRFPSPVDVGTDHDGALRIVWENGPRLLELVVPYERDASAYFYYSSGDEYNLQRDLGLDAVRARFHWLNVHGG